MTASVANTPLVAETDEQIAACFPVLSELRPHLQEKEFVGLIRSMQSDGYRLAFIEEGSRCVAAAGYRIRTSLFMGRNMYVDDLVTTSASRSMGYGAQMMQWLRNEARRNDCAFLHLDSGTQRHRAHRFYLKQGLDISSFHFSQRLDGG